MADGLIVGVIITAGSAEDMSGNDIVSTSGRTDVGAEGEAVLSLTSAQRANIDQLLERHAQLLMVSDIIITIIIIAGLV